MGLVTASKISAARRTAYRCALGVAGLLGCMSTTTLVHAAGDRPTPLKIDVISDRLTLALTRYPQVYLHGDMDPDASRRFADLMSRGRIVAGSDVYLNARGGDRAAGLALGRMFRAAGMATHLGTPRLPKQASYTQKIATCTDACAYAWLGGLYRWAPSGRDRMGFTAAATAATQDAAVTTYLKDMGVDPAALTPATAASGDGTAWLTADQLIASGVANNGALTTTATYNLSAAAPTLELRQVDRKGAHRLTIQCQPGKTTVTAYDEVGLERARQIVLRGTSSYVQFGQDKLLDEPRDGAQVADNALMIRRDVPPADLGDLVSAWSFGAWVNGRSEAFRDGFTMPLHAVHPQLKVYYYACWRAAPWTPKAKKAA